MSEPTSTPSADEIQARLGSGAEAIRFALLIEDHFNRDEFLQEWLVGDLSLWPEFDARIEGCEPNNEEPY
jgi:hypothetical protein